MGKKDIEMGQKPVVAPEAAKVAPIEMGQIDATGAIAPIEMGQIDAAVAPAGYNTANDVTAESTEAEAKGEDSPPWEEPPAKASDVISVKPVSDFELEFNEMIASLSTAAQFPLLRIFEYTKAMKPGVINTLDEGIRHQVNLYRSILSVINSTGDEFVAAYNVLLKIAHRFENQAFGELYVFRYMDQLTLSAESRKGFTRVINLIKATCEPSSRAAVVRQINMDATLQYDITEMGKQNIYNYYKV